MNAALSRLRTQPHWSYSSINQLVNICGLQWALRKVYGIKPEFTPASLAFGGAFHAAATWLATERMAGGMPNLDAVHDRFTESWQQQQADAAPSIRFSEKWTPETLHTKGLEMLEALYNDTDPDEEVIAVGEVFSVHLYDRNGNRMKHPLIGELDCVVRKADRVEIVDWKTSATRWSESKARTDLQATAYLHYWRTGHPDDHVSFRYDIVTKTKVPVVQHCETTRSGSDFIRLGEITKALQRMVEAQAFVPAENSFACAQCPHADACRNWHVSLAA